MGFLADALVMLRVKWQMRSVTISIDPADEDLAYCYDVLQAVSRSFTVVIKQITDKDLRDGICLFYLVLRALDTVEDDMSVPLETKLAELPKFHTHLHEPTWNMTGVGKGRELELLEQFPRVTREFHKLRKEYQNVIEDICVRMAKGMCEFLQRPVVTKEDYNLYCHYVAGLVGHGLTRLFASCGFEDATVADDLVNANHMGLFLQKTNIIRDYFEDIREEPPRMFWPKEIWGNYAEKLDEFRDPNNKVKALQCLNAMVADAMTHVPFVVDYMASLHDPSIVRFCAIPQVMAMGTLSAVYNNADTFQIKVKMTKADSCRVMLYAADLYQSFSMFKKYCVAMEKELDPADASTPLLRERLHQGIAKIDALLQQQQPPVTYTRSLLTRYPALGGQLVTKVVDAVTGYFNGNSNLVSGTSS